MGTQPKEKTMKLFKITDGMATYWVRAHNPIHATLLICQNEGVLDEWITNGDSLDAAGVSDAEAADIKVHMDTGEVLSLARVVADMEPAEYGVIGCSEW